MHFKGHLLPKILITAALLAPRSALAVEPGGYQLTQITQGGIFFTC